MQYSDAINKELKKQGIEAGHRIHVEKDGQVFEGLLMPKSSGDENTLVIKLDNGYNAGIAFKGAKIKKLKGEIRKKTAKLEKYRPDAGKKNITILHTGGTVASRVDYETGGVVASVTPEEILLSVPELSGIANIKARIVSQIMSEDMEPEHWIEIAKVIKEEIDRNCDGIIITHGTDTMHYTSSALSFALQNLPIPVLLVGSQRSSDRGSSDAAMNLICAAYFIAKTDFAGIAICMHATPGDEYCFVHPGVNAKKMHTSRRDAFRSIDVYPTAKVSKNGDVEFFGEYPKKGNLKFSAAFDKNVAIIKMRPGFSYKELEAYEKLGFRGIVIEGTGLGHAPVNDIDKFTKEHKKLLEVLQRMAKKGVIIAMTSQCPYGRVNLNVYSTGRELQNAGVISLAMLPETAFVKLCWCLGHTKDPKEAKSMLTTNYVGEIVEKIDPRVFLF